MKEKLCLPDYVTMACSCSLSGEIAPPKETQGRKTGTQGQAQGQHAPRGQLHVGCPFLVQRFDSVYEILPVSPRFGQSQTHVMHPFVSKDKRRREAELEKERQRKRTAYAKKAELLE